MFDAVMMLPLALLGPVLPTLVVIGGIGFLIFVHELGHFLVAKWCKVRVEAFSLGFGPVLFGFHRGDTHYRLSAIPLGGYVKMAGETLTDEHSNDPAEFQNKTKLQRIAILLAGVTMNAIGAFFLFVVAFNFGVPLPSPVVGSVVPGSPAWEAGMLPGDKVIRIDDQEIIDFDDVIQEIAFAGGAVDVTVLRDGEEVVFRGIAPRVDPTLGVPMVGIGMKRVLAIADDSQAALGGLMSGDEILSVNGVEAADLNGIRQNLELPPKDLPVVVRRDGKVVQLTVPTTLESTEDARPLIGISSMMNRIAALRPGQGPATKAGFMAEDLLLAVDGRRVTDLDQARLYATEATSPVTFLVQRKSKEITLDPVTAADWDAFFDDIAPGGVSTEDPRIRLLPDRQFKDGNPARETGLKDGARILTVNGKKVASFTEIHERISETKGDDPVRVTFTLAGEENPELSIVRRSPVGWNSGIALAPVTNKVKITGVVPSCREGVRRSILNARRIMQTLGGLVTGKLSAKTLGGPVRIFQISYHTAKRDFMHFLYFLGILSINLAILNVLPIPLLDGGHILFILFEAVRGKPMPERVMAGFQWAGLLFLLLVLVFVVTNDLSNIF
jgi:regulator of sigma E protease